MPKEFINDYWTPNNPDAYWIAPTTRKQRNTGWQTSALVEDGDFVICAVSGKEIRLQNLSYWNVDLQEAYFSPKEVKERLKNLKNK